MTIVDHKLTKHEMDEWNFPRFAFYVELYFKALIIMNILHRALLSPVCFEGAERPLSFSYSRKNEEMKDLKVQLPLQPLISGFRFMVGTTHCELLVIIY